jgi:hypothetical protein
MINGSKKQVENIDNSNEKLLLSDVMHSILVNMLKEVYRRANADGSAEIYNAEFIGTNIHQALPIEGEDKVISDVLEKYCA